MSEKLTAGDLKERLAEIEHERWADWQAYVHGQGAAIWWEFPANTHTFGGFVVSPALIERWERQIATPYADLDEAEKQSDRDQVDRYWPLIEKFIDAEVARRLGAES